MLHAKLQNHRPSGSGEEKFKQFLLFIAKASILVMWPGPFMQISFPLPKNAPQTVLTLIGQAVSEKKIMEIVDRGMAIFWAEGLMWAKTRYTPAYSSFAL